MASSSTDNVMAGPAVDPSSTTIPEHLSLGLQVTYSVQVAHILFGPVLYPHYLGWQATILGFGGARFPGSAHVREEIFKARRSDTLGDLPSLVHYKHFMNLMIQLHPGLLYSQYFENGHPKYGTDPTRDMFICGHRPHPAGKFRKTPLCLRCLVRYNIDTLKRIAAARALLPLSEDGQMVPGTKACSTIWSHQKVYWRTLVNDLELEAGLEYEWEAKWKPEGLDVDAAVKGTIRSSEVLEEAISKCPFVAGGWYVDFKPKPRRRPALCRYRSILRLGVTDVQPRNCARYPLSLCFSRHEDPAGTHGNNLTDDICPSSLLDSNSSGSPDTPSSPDTITSSPQEDSPVEPGVVRKKVEWAAAVAEYVSRPFTHFLRTSALYQPGRWACPDRCGWARHDGPEYEPEEEDDSDERPSDEEKVDEEELLDENKAGTPDSLAEMPTPHRRSRSRKRALSMDGESIEAREARCAATCRQEKAKRRRLRFSQELEQRRRNSRAQREQVTRPSYKMDDDEVERFGEGRINAEIRRNRDRREAIRKLFSPSEPNDLGMTEC